MIRRQFLRNAATALSGLAVAGKSRPVAAPITTPTTKAIDESVRMQALRDFNQEWCASWCVVRPDGTLEQRFSRSTNGILKIEC